MCLSTKNSSLILHMLLAKMLCHIHWLWLVISFLFFSQINYYIKQRIREVQLCCIFYIHETIVKFYFINTCSQFKTTFLFTHFLFKLAHNFVNCISFGTARHDKSYSTEYRVHYLSSIYSLHKIQWYTPMFQHPCFDTPICRHPYDPIPPCSDILCSNTHIFWTPMQRGDC